MSVPFCYDVTSNLSGSSWKRSSWVTLASSCCGRRRLGGVLGTPALQYGMIWFALMWYYDAIQKVIAAVPRSTSRRAMTVGVQSSVGAAKQMFFEW